MGFYTLRRGSCHRHRVYPLILFPVTPLQPATTRREISSHTIPDKRLRVHTSALKTPRSRSPADSPYS
jgi:hypothetical protein